MGGDSNDLDITRDVHLADGSVRYQARFTLGGENIVPPSPWWTPALQRHLVLAGAEGPEAVKAVMALRPDLQLWAEQLPPKLRAALLAEGWTPDPVGGDPGEDPGAP